jgi:hypothetical protein
VPNGAFLGFFLEKPATLYFAEKKRKWKRAEREEKSTDHGLRV